MVPLALLQAGGPYICNIIMEKPTIICGVQQVGVGIKDVVEAYNWYIKAFGVDILVADALGVAERMLPYTGGKPRPRRAVLAANLKGGGGLEVWQPMDNNITPPKEAAALGDYGIAVCKVKALEIERAYSHFGQLEGASLLGGISEAPYGKRHFYITDPYGNIFEIVEDDYTLFNLKQYPTGGVHGAVIGVSDMDKSIDFYARLLGYDKVLFDSTGEFEDLKGLPGGNGVFRRVLITTTAPLQGPFAELYGYGVIELLQAYDRTPKKVFEGRWWGDPGFIQICFDIRNMEGMRARAKALGHDFVCDGGTDFKMAEADGHFTYVEDPDGTLIELVETYRVPVYKKLGIYLNVKNKDARKTLPRLIMRAMKFLRVKNIHA